MENRNLTFKIMFCVGALAAIIYVFIPIASMFGMSITMWSVLTSDEIMSLVSFEVDSEAMAYLCAVLFYWLPAILLIVSSVMLFIEKKLKVGLILADIGVVNFLVIDVIMLVNEVVYAGVFVNIIGVLVVEAAAILLYINEKKERSAVDGDDDDAAVGEITCLAGEYAGGKFYIESTLVIGRDASCANIVLRNKNVSREHCVIKYVPETDTYTVKDMSTNGTFFSDGHRLVKNYEMQVKRGTEIYLGEPKEVFILD